MNTLKFTTLILLIFGFISTPFSHSSSVILASQEKSTSNQIFTVTYKNYDGTVYDIQNYNYGEEIIFPNPPARPNNEKIKYFFTNWIEEPSSVLFDKTFVANYTWEYINIPGDLNKDGKLNNKDISRLFKYLSNIITIDNDIHFDLNMDGKVNNKDIYCLLKYTSDLCVDIQFKNAELNWIFDKMTSNNIFLDNVILSLRDNKYIIKDNHIEYYYDNIDENLLEISVNNDIKIYYKNDYNSLKTALDIFSSNDSNYDYSTIEQYKNKSVTFIGDSITAGIGTTKKYYEYLADYIEFSNIQAMGVSGSCISNKSNYGNGNSPLINRYKDIPSSNLIVIFIGTNDYSHDTPLGCKTDTTDETFFGSLDIIMSNLLQDYPNSKIVFITPCHKYKTYVSKINNTSFTYDFDKNGYGYTLSDYVDAIIYMCKKYNIEFIDLFNLWNIDVSNLEIRNKYIPDGIHPNNDGCEVIAKIVYKNLCKIGFETNIISNNMIYGNKFATGFTNNKTRLSLSKNIYLKAGTLIKLIDNSTYQYAVTKTTDEYSNNMIDSWLTGGWSNKYVEIIEDGYYGFTFKKIDNSTFNNQDLTISLNDLISM